MTEGKLQITRPFPCLAHLSEDIHDQVFVVFKKRVESLDSICHTGQDIRFLKQNSRIFHIHISTSRFKNTPYCFLVLCYFVYQKCIFIKFLGKFCRTQLKLIFQLNNKSQGILAMNLNYSRLILEMGLWLPDCRRFQIETCLSLQMGGIRVPNHYHYTYSYCKTCL